MSGEELLRITGSAPMEIGSELYGSTSTAEASGTSPASVFMEQKQRKKSSPTKKTNSTTTTTAERLHSDWQTVMEVASKTKHENFKCDLNISKKFFNIVTETAKRLNCNPDDLAAIMFLESHFDPKAKKGDYRGLIQIDKMSFDSIPNTKCTYSQYCALPREKQIKYVEKYLKMRIDEQGLKGFLSGGQLYTLVRRPKSVRTKSEVVKNQKLVTDARKVPAKIKKEKAELDKKTKANSKSNSSTKTNTKSNTKQKKLNIKS